MGTIRDVFDEAARDLPDLWNIKIEIGIGFADVYLFDPRGVRIEVEKLDDDSISDWLKKCVTVARNKVRRQGGKPSKV